MKHFNISLEAEITDGKARNEFEFVIYAKLLNPQVLAKADAAYYQLQSSVKGKVRGSSIRVRKEMQVDPKTYNEITKPTYVLTGKAPSENSQGLDEVSCDASEDLLRVFKVMSGEYMEKIRFEFKEDRIPTATKWEVDVFLDTEGTAQEYIKIDLEVTDEKITKLQYMPDQLELEDVIISRAGKYENEKQAALVSEMFDKYFITKITY